MLSYGGKDLSDRLPVTEEQARQFAEGIRVLAQPQRLVILFLLCEKQRIVADIERLTGIAQPMLSQYLAQLRRSRLVISHRQGRQTFYALAQTAEAAQTVAILNIITQKKPDTSSSAASEEVEEELLDAHGAMFARLL
ncbi:metalloregulator ArsR/SmtB family transcription factor [Saccharibacter sp. 17.LH.SD]|uniref:ArsR/SmtB family transcription factor n=1 Tax=Saccharibacter sp. 17.LH.SD TaxID=2689393 RepID=UPI00136F07B5|nr:metalloregulator ArsR/SmtB family transcription factor [Saccharibacter sp. 17.LH.SD]MXV45034.1 metalloregulator ArsR/SmtB family transcription factor [Saccharibacter sp. 17.LH.SD]